MPRLAIFRSMHNVRPGEQHRPSRAVELDPAAVAFLAACDVEVGTAWALDRLTEIRKRMESESKLLRAYVIESTCKAMQRTVVDDEVRAAVRDRLATDHRYVAVEQFVVLAREAEAGMMTLVFGE
jgi:hypothetical protein